MTLTTKDTKEEDALKTLKALIDNLTDPVKLTHEERQAETRLYLARLSKREAAP